MREWPSSNPKPDEIAPLAENFKPLYSGVDLSGWKQEHAGHWRTNDWILENDGKSEATNKHLWTEKEFGDFVLIADWKSPRPTGEAKAGGAGVLSLRGSEHAETTISSQGSKAGEWNRYVVTLRGNRLTVVLNGKTITNNRVLSELPRRGAIGLRHQGSSVQFANLFVQELD